MQKYIFIVFLSLLGCTNNIKQEFKLQQGDLLFQDLDSSPLCDAIELVTPGYKGANLSHVGIVIDSKGDSCCTNTDYNNDIIILEAIPKKVQIISLDSFLNRSFDKYNNPKVIVGRLKKKHQHTIKNAIKFLKNKIGEKYDNAFLINNNAYYCSELVYEAFIRDSIFKLTPMTFLHPKTNDTLSVWQDYYNNLNIEIPQNKLGINPGIMSLSKKIDIIHYYGYPDGLMR